MSLGFEALVVVFAVARLTRLIVDDEITKSGREWAVRRLSEGNPLAYLLYCRWCLSMWIAMPAAACWWVVSAAPRWSGHWWVDVPTLALAVSYATGLLVRAEPPTV